MKRLIAGVVVAAGVAVFAGVGPFGDETTRNDAGQITEGGGLGAFVIKNGDCINLPAESLVASVEGVPCGRPHDAEAYHVFDLADGPYPGLDGVTASADDGCYSAFHPFVGVALEYSSLDVMYFHPTEDSWNELDDREIVCLVTTMDGSQLTGTMRGSGR
jgi:Septum formation